MIKQHKVVSALPAPLEADSVYFVRVGAGFDVVVTNGAGTIVPYELNAKSALAQKAASGINADITNLTALNSILALPLGLSFNANTKIYPESNGMKIQLGSPTSATGYITIKSTGELVLESAGLTVGGSLLPKATTMLLGNTAFPWSQAYIKTLMMTGPMNGAAAVTVASAATVDLGAASVTSNSVVISGTTTITSFGTGASAPIGAERNVRFSGNLTLTHSANLILPGAAPIITAAGDCATFQYVAAGVWRCTAYLRADGKSLALGTPVFPGDFGLGDHMKFTENATAGTAMSNIVGNGFFACTDQRPSDWKSDGGGGTYPLGFTVQSTAALGLQVAAGNGSNALHYRVRGPTSFLDWRKIFDNANILRVVGRSGSLVTGAIFETGSNPSGNYVKFADGTLICRVTATTPNTAWSAFGSGFISPNVDVVLPATFATAGDMIVVGNDNASTTVSVNGQVINTSMVRVAAYHPTSVGVPARTLRLVVIGRWYVEA